MAAGLPEPVGPDLEVVELLPAETAGTDHHAAPLTLLLRLSRDGYESSQAVARLLDSLQTLDKAEAATPGR